MRLLVMVVVVFAVFPLVYWLLTKINSRVASEADEGSLPGQVAKAEGPQVDSQEKEEQGREETDMNSETYYYIGRQGRERGEPAHHPAQGD